MRNIMILDKDDFNGEAGDLSALKTLRGDWEKQVDDIFLIQPYNTIRCLKSQDDHKGLCTLADFVKYLLEE